ncbi:MAG: GNAT family N-acetyltransferase [Planctomycetota bacterium]|jgi:RimJ/RimL family protein N-acetyltransferase
MSGGDGDGGGPADGDVRLRSVTEDDVAVFFEHQRDPVARRMAAFTTKDPADREAFTVRWSAILRDDSIVKRTVLLDGTVAGHAASFERAGAPEITYWIGREHWGRGVATRAVQLFLAEVTARPLHARAARDNVASIRVLEKCGFVITGVERSFAAARDQVIEELLLELR